MNIMRLGLSVPKVVKCGLVSAVPQLRHVSGGHARRARQALNLAQRRTGSSMHLLNPLAGGSGGGSGRGSIRLCASGGEGAGGSSSGFSGLWSKYMQLLESAPLLTRAVTCGVLNGLGDVFCQLVLEKGDLDLKRAAVFTAIGLAFVGPVLFYWYNILGALVPGSGLMSILGSLALDQLLFAPTFIAAFMSVITFTMEGTHDLPSKVSTKLKNDWVPAVQVGWLLWVPAQFVNFMFVPPNLRILAVNMTALIWNVYMSYQSHKTVPAVAV